MDGSRLRVVAGGTLLLALLGTTPVTAEQREWCNDITSNTTWRAADSHLVKDGCTVRVKNATLTVEAGADIRMGKDANLVIDAGSRLVATVIVGENTAGPPIVFRANGPDEPGSWGQIRFEPGAEASVMRGALLTDSTIDPVRVRAGGAGGVPMVEVHDAVVEMDWLILEKAGDVPLAFTPAALGPSLDVPGSSTVRGACQRVRLTDNTVPAIRILADAANDVTTSMTWHNFCVPYRVDGEILVAGPVDPDNPDLFAPVLSIDVGTEIRFGPEGALVVGLDAEHPGELSVNGTIDEPITLAAASETPGGWRGITISAYGGLSSLYNATIAYGGHGDQPMVTILSPDAMALGVVFRGAAGYPLAISPQALSSFLEPLYFETGAEDPVFVDNGINRVKVLARQAPYVTADMIWGDVGVPYDVDGDVILAGPTSPRLTLRNGADLVFSAGTRLQIGDTTRGPGEIDARGIEGRPVRLTAATEEPGGWVGLRITDKATIATLDLVEIAYGGTTTAPMVQWGAVTGDLTRTTFRGAAGYPLSIPMSHAHDVLLAPDVPEDAEGADLRNEVVENGTDRFLVFSERVYSISLSKWLDPGAPVEFSTGVVVTSPTQPLLELGPGLMLLFPPTKGLQLGDATGGRAALLVNITAPGAAPVFLGPVNAEQGWAGVRLLPGSDLRVGGGLKVSGVAEGAANIALQDATAALVDLELQGHDGRGTGLDVAGAGSQVTVSESLIAGHRVGIHVRDGGRLEITRSFIQGNTEFGLRSDNPDQCLIAPLVWWGHQQGPNDTSDAEDGCLNGANLNPAGDRVSDDVDWWPYAIDAEFTPSRGLGPNPKKAYCPHVVRRN